MKKSELRKIAKQNIQEGKSKQETYEILRDASTLPAEELAKIVQSFPSAEAKNKYKALNITLMILLGITATGKVLAGLPLVLQHGVSWTPVLFLFPLINIALLIAVGMYSSGAHKAVGILSAFGLLRYFNNVRFDSFDVYMGIELGFIITLIALGFYLNSVLCPSYKKIGETYLNQQGQKRMRYNISFPD